MAGFSLGCIKDPEDRRDYRATMRLAAEPPILPGRWSWRSSMTPVRNQGGLGSCVGFACTALKEFQEVHQRPWTPFKDSSEMFVYWGAKEIDPWPGRQGTSIRCALKVLAQKGLPPERGWPYLDRAAPGHTPPTKPKWWSYGVARWGKIGAYYRLDSLQEVKEWLVSNGPVVAGVAVGTSFFTPQKHEGCPDGSFVEMPESTIGGHAILLVSYNDLAVFPGGIFGFKNSWGLGWGDSGYGFFSDEYLLVHGFDLWGVLDY